MDSNFRSVNPYRELTMTTTTASPYASKQIENPSGSMILIPAGEFEMGSETGSESERPVHRVYLNVFAIDQTLVTNQAFAQFIAETGYITVAERQGSAWGFDGARFRNIAGLQWRSASGGGRD